MVEMHIVGGYVPNIQIQKLMLIDLHLVQRTVKNLRMLER